MGSTIRVSQVCHSRDRQLLDRSVKIMVLCSTTEITRTFSVMTGGKTIILCPMTQENNATFCNGRIQNREALSNCRKKQTLFFNDFFENELKTSDTKMITRCYRTLINPSAFVGYLPWTNLAQHMDLSMLCCHQAWIE